MPPRGRPRGGRGGSTRGGNRGGGPPGGNVRGGGPPGGNVPGGSVRVGGPGRPRGGGGPPRGGTGGGVPSRGDAGGGGSGTRSTRGSGPRGAARGGAALRGGLTSSNAASTAVASVVESIGVKRPGPGTAGNSLTIITNHFATDIPKSIIYHYDGTSFAHIGSLESPAADPVTCRPPVVSKCELLTLAASVTDSSHLTSDIVWEINRADSATCAML